MKKEFEDEEKNVTDQAKKATDAGATVESWDPKSGDKTPLRPGEKKPEAPQGQSPNGQGGQAPAPKS